MQAAKNAEHLQLGEEGDGVPCSHVAPVANHGGNKWDIPATVQAIHGQTVTDCYPCGTKVIIHLPVMHRCKQVCDILRACTAIWKRNTKAARAAIVETQRKLSDEESQKSAIHIFAKMVPLWDQPSFCCYMQVIVSQVEHSEKNDRQLCIHMVGNNR